MVSFHSQTILKDSRETMEPQMMEPIKICLPIRAQERGDPPEGQIPTTITRPNAPRPKFRTYSVSPLTQWVEMRVEQ